LIHSYSNKYVLGVNCISIILILTISNEVTKCDKVFNYTVITHIKIQQENVTLNFKETKRMLITRSTRRFQKGGYLRNRKSVFSIFSIQVIPVHWAYVLFGSSLLTWNILTCLSTDKTLTGLVQKEKLQQKYTSIKLFYKISYKTLTVSKWNVCLYCLYDGFLIIYHD